jgi:hypothetical protein
LVYLVSTITFNRTLFSETWYTISEIVRSKKNFG